MHTTCQSAAAPGITITVASEHSGSKNGVDQRLKNVPDLAPAGADRRESLHHLLDRLEQVLGPAVDDQIFVDEINGSNRLPRGGFARL